MVGSIRKQVTTEVTNIRSMQGLLELDIPSDFHIRLDATVKIGETQCDPIEQTDHTLTVVQRDADVDLSTSHQLSQDQWIHDPFMVAVQLNEYWDQFWNRDKQTMPDWSEFQELLDDTPALEPLTITLDDPQLWKQAANMMKSRSARGVDGFLVDELKSLPHCAFCALSQIFMRLPSQSFGKTLAQVLTLPLAKVEDPSLPSQTRPITLVAILYRLWAKTTTMQILQQWKDVIPNYIIGFLPGRSPETEMIKQQYLFELAHTTFANQRIVWQGLTLDLVKCFNLIGRHPAAQALKKAGIPPHLVDTWYETLKDQTRLWKVDNNLFKFGHTTTGTPEGDSWSVLACIAISRIWAHQIVNKGASPSCYADNWSLKSDQDQITENAIETTITCARAFKLLIDWAKTWCWRTSSQGKREWKTRMQALLPQEIKVQIVTSARELGYTMAYNKVQSRQTQRQRHADTIRRVHRIRKMKTSLQVRAQVCADACLHKALFATATYHVGNPWIKELRSLIAKTLVPDRRNSNPFLANQLLSKYIRDPELHLIVDCIRCIRRFMYTLPSNEQQEFFHFVSRHSGAYQEVFGPAGALRSNLLRIGWQIDKQGWLITDSKVQFHLLNDNLPDIIRFVEHCWMKHVMQCRIQRRKWLQFPVPDRTATIRLFQKLPDNQQQVLASQITGAYMLGEQRLHIDDATDKCALCGQTEDIHHRLLRCPEMQHVRTQHQAVVSFLEEHHECHMYLPVVYQDEDFEFNTWFFRQLPEPELLEDVLLQAQSELDQGKRPYFWTDGSCNTPSHWGFRRAAFGIVYHSHLLQEEVQDIVRKYEAVTVTPKSFQVLCSAPCQGTQTIPRAEMQAILALIRQIDSAHIFTDSQYVIDQASKIGIMLDKFKFHRCPNFDLLCKLWDRLQVGDFILQKVKAHDVRVQHDSYWESFCKIGNEAADQVAKQARQRFEKQCNSSATCVDQDSNQLVKDNFAFRYDLQVERAKMLTAKQHINRPLYASKTFQEQLSTLTPVVDTPWTFVAMQDDFKAVQTCLWGTQYAIQILRWLETLQWPTATSDTSVGISWYELACNFLMVANVGFVINTGGTGRDFLPRRLCVASNEVVFSRQVFSFERAITNIQAILQRPILPMERTIATSVRLLGLPVGKSGLARRPAMWYQDDLALTLVQHFSGGDIPSECPPFSYKEPLFDVPVQADDVEQTGNWVKRIQLHHHARKRR